MIKITSWLFTANGCKREKPTIAVNWAVAKKSGIIDGDFYLADLLSNKNDSFKLDLSVLLKNNYYKLSEKKDDIGELFREIQFNDQQVAHMQFWNRYDRPPKEEY